LRYDFFDARSTLPSDLANPANSIAGAPASVPIPTTLKSTLSPRIGISYPVTKESSLYFAYGHFYQMPALRDIFDNANYSVLANLQAKVSYLVMGNPNIRPERTVQYQFGYKQAITENLGLDVNAFYKDVRDLLGTEFISTYNDAEYARLANVDFGSIIGATIAVDQRELGPISFALDYTWQLAQGDASDPRETATRASQGLDATPRQIPFNWDQRHTLNLTTTLAQPNGYTVSSVLRVASGQPYTPTVSAGGFGLESNSGRKPLSWVVDLRGESPLHLGGLSMRGFARVFNLFDTRFFNGTVFATSGNPYASSSPADRTALDDPTRFYPPRRIEFGVTMGDAK
jgi:outer membrane receptor protein involved in Fe transport